LFDPGRNLHDVKNLSWLVHAHGPKRPAIHEFHRYRGAFSVFLEIVKANNVWMRQLKISAQLLFEPFDLMVVVDEMVGQKLKRDWLLEHAIVSKPNRSHRSFPENSFEIIPVEDPQLGNELARLISLSAVRHGRFQLSRKSAKVEERRTRQ
jgi:hypothetical protein